MLRRGAGGCENETLLRRVINLFLSFFFSFLLPDDDSAWLLVDIELDFAAGQAHHGVIILYIASSLSPPATCTHHAAQLAIDYDHHHACTHTQRTTTPAYTSPLCCPSAGHLRYKILGNGDVGLVLHVHAEILVVCLRSFNSCDFFFSSACI